MNELQPTEPIRFVITHSGKRSEEEMEDFIHSEITEYVDDGTEISVDALKDEDEYSISIMGVPMQVAFTIRSALGGILAGINAELQNSLFDDDDEGWADDDSDAEEAEILEDDESTDTSH